MIRIHLPNKIIRGFNIVDVEYFRIVYQKHNTTKKLQSIYIRPYDNLNKSIDFKIHLTSSNFDTPAYELIINILLHYKDNPYNPILEEIFKKCDIGEFLNHIRNLKQSDKEYIKLRYIA